MLVGSGGSATSAAQDGGKLRCVFSDRDFVPNTVTLTRREFKLVIKREERERERGRCQSEREKKTADM